MEDINVNWCVSTFIKKPFCSRAKLHCSASYKCLCLYLQLMEGMAHGESLVNVRCLVGVGCVRENGNVTILNQSTQGRHVKSRNWDRVFKHSLVIPTNLVQVNNCLTYVIDNWMNEWNNFHKITTKCRLQSFPSGRRKCTLKCLYFSDFVEKQSWTDVKERVSTFSESC